MQNFSQMEKKMLAKLFNNLPKNKKNSTVFSQMKRTKSIFLSGLLYKHVISTQQIFPSLLRHFA